MTWLWVVAPAIVLLGALWLALGLRRLIAGRLSITDDASTTDAHESALDRVRDASTRTRRRFDTLSESGVAETEPRASDR